MSDPSSQFTEAGFAVFPGAVNNADLDALRARIDDLVEDFDPAGVGTVFSTDDQSHGRDDYFLSSGDQIRFFFEDGALSSNGTILVDKRQSLNKIGHAMHDLDAVSYTHLTLPTNREV